MERMILVFLDFFFLSDDYRCLAAKQVGARMRAEPGVKSDVNGDNERQSGSMDINLRVGSLM